MTTLVGSWAISGLVGDFTISHTLPLHVLVLLSV
jgi:hypothetical protein